MLSPPLMAEMIELAAMLSTVLVFAAVFRKQVRRGWLLASLGAIIAGMVALNRGYGLIPEPDIFDLLRWNWYDFLLLTAVSFAIILATPQGWKRSGLTLAQTGPGVLPGLAVTLALCGLLSWMAVQNVFGAPDFDLETVAFNALAVGPAEELFFRGVVFALVLEAFGARRVLLRAEVNWGIVPAGLVFGFAHLTSSPGGEEIVINYFATLWTCLGGLVLAWLRQASGSLVMPYTVHAYGNVIQYVL